MSEPHVLHLPEKYAAQVRALLQAHIPEAQVWAYGSRVRGDHYEASDLDLVARFPATAQRDAFRLSALTDALTESNLPILVQVLDWDAIPASFRDEIRACCVLVQRGSPGQGPGA